MLLLGSRLAGALSSSTRHRAVTLPASIGTSTSASATTLALARLRLELGAQGRELASAVVDRLHEGEVLFVEQSITMGLCRLVVFHAHGSESRELAAMNHIGVQHEDVLRHAYESCLHPIHVRLDLVRLV